ncbi:beta-propeller fold lactonase family protein [Streptosporangium sp. KLBMP 9127]|nr:lactonase family protein [Streptosporangium sp. KLBMP 9127]
MGTTRLIYIGGYTVDAGGTGPGITTVLVGHDGKLTVAAETTATAPSFLAAHPRLPVLYAVGETERGTVSAYTRRADGTLSRIAELPSGGSDPCHVAVDPQGTWLAVANYGDGTLGAYRLDEFGRMVGRAKLFHNTGSGPDGERQASPHAHQSTFGSDCVLYVTDLGTDEVRRYLVGDEIVPHPDGNIRITPGTGPRHLAYTAGRWYLAGELDGSVSVYDENWTELGRVPASQSATPRNFPSHLEISPDGRSVYVANRGPNTITVLAAEPELSRVAETPCGGKWPRHFAVLDDRMYVANQRSGHIAVLALKSGVPEATGDLLPVGTPACVLADL